MDDSALFLDDIDEFDDMQSPMNLVTLAVVGACIEVHRLIGPGFSRDVYADALAHELKLRQVGFVRRERVALMYKGKPVGGHELDFIVEGMVVLKIKSVKMLRPVHTAAMTAYLKAAEKRLGLIINFNVKTLMNGVERVALK